MKILKNPLFTFILGVIITSGIVYAATKIQATEIEYAPNITVKDKIDDLYSKVPTGTKIITEKGNQIDISKFQYADTTGMYTLNEYNNHASEQYDLGYIEGIENAKKQFTYSTSNRASHSIPAGVKVAYLLYSNGTSDSVLTLSISGSIVVSTSEVAYTSNVDNYSYPLRSSLKVYKLILNGNAGTITTSTSGGSGGGRAWTTALMY